MFDLRVEIRKKLVLKEGLKSKKSIGETLKLKNQKDNLSETPEEKEFIEYIENKSKTIDYDLIKEYFNFKVPRALAKKKLGTKDKKKNNELVELIRVRWSNLQDEIEKMSEDKKPDKILEIVEEILVFNRKKNQRVD